MKRPKLYVKKPDPWEVYRLQARAEFKSATAFRIGMMVGRAGAGLPSPFHPNHPLSHRYLDGVRTGQNQRGKGQP
ncbi:hypothetical protein D3C85_929340 [compost metagenome]